MTCKILWKPVGKGCWNSTDKRFAIRKSGGSTALRKQQRSERYYVVDLDTYNEAGAKTLRAAKAAACRLKGQK